MSTVNKVLNAFILTFAVICSIFSYKMYLQRIELRNRADFLAATTAKIAETLDSKGELATELDLVKEINPNFLSWKSYRKSRDVDGSYKSWEIKVEQLQRGVEQLSSMKSELAEDLISISTQLEMKQEEGVKAGLNSVNTFKAHSEEIVHHTKLFNEHQKRTNKALVSLSKAMKKEQKYEDFSNIHQADEVQEQLSRLVQQASQLHGNRTILANGLKQLAGSFPKDQDGDKLFQPSWANTDFHSANPQDLQQGFRSISKDFALMNQKFFELKVANRLVGEQRSQLTLKENVIEELNSENDQLKNNNGRLSAQIKRLKKQIIVQLPAPSKDIQATVIEVNERFNFLIINKGKENGVTQNSELVIHHKGKLICTAKVSKVLNNKAVCDVLPNPLSQAAVSLPVTGSSASSHNP
jgi:hypothetical protein